MLNYKIDFIINENNGRTKFWENVEGRGKLMPGIKIKEHESFESAMRRFKKQCEKAGVLSEIRKREHYDKPSVRKKKKIIAARKKSRRFY